MKNWFNKLNRNELLIGFLYPLMFLVWLKWLCLLCCPLTSLLWAASGVEGSDKIWRRLACPSIVGIALFAVTHGYALLGIPLSFAVQSIGYGIPDSTDKGSALGRFWMTWAQNNADLANVFTRGTIYLLLFISFRIFLE